MPEDTTPPVTVYTPVVYFSQFNIAFSENVIGMSNGGWSIRINGGAPVQLSYQNGDGSQVGVFSIPYPFPVAGDVVTYNYDNFAGNTQDPHANRLAAITDQPAFNGNQ
jgi:hypothetical protein